MYFFLFFTVQNKMPATFSPVGANVLNIAVVHFMSLEPGVLNIHTEFCKATISFAEFSVSTQYIFLLVRSFIESF